MTGKFARTRFGLGRALALGAVIGVSACASEKATRDAAIVVPEPIAAQPKPAPKPTPEAFETTDAAVWDGKPSLGNVWVAVPDAIRPERVLITNEDTGKTVQGGMFAHAMAPTKDAPIRVSSGAAAALGIDAETHVRLTITALRGPMPHVADRAPVIAMSEHRDVPLVVPEPVMATRAYLPPPMLPAMLPHDTAPPFDGFVEVAQSITPQGALNVETGLQAARIGVTVKEQMIGGAAVYRVFARADTNPADLSGTLETIRWANAEEDGTTDTLVAEMPNFDTLQDAAEPAPAWVEFGAYPAQNEAVAVVQRLARQSIPTEICTLRQGLLAIHRVFAGPAATDTVASDLVAHAKGDGASGGNAAFCRGVAAAESARPVGVPVPLGAPEPVFVEPEGAVRIKVGQATGGLSLDIPNPFSPPIPIVVDGVTLRVPANTPPELLQRIEAALSGL